MKSIISALHVPAGAVAAVLAVVVTATWPMSVTADERGDYRRPARDPAWQHGGYTFPGSRAGSFRQRRGHVDRNGPGVATRHRNQRGGYDAYRGYGHGDRGRSTGTTSFSRRSSDLQGYSRRAPPPELNRSGPRSGSSGAARPDPPRGYGERRYEYRGFDHRHHGRLHGDHSAGERHSSSAGPRDARGRD